MRDSEPRDLKAVMGCLTDWAQNLLSEDLAANIYVFGSMVNSNGRRFESTRSDVDLVVEFPSQVETDPVGRFRVTKSLRVKKVILESSLFSILKRNGGNSIVSIVLVTNHELLNGVHKDGNPRFFSDSSFKRLDLSGAVAAPLGPPASERIYTSPAIAVLKGAQKFRNQYLNVSANGSSLLPEYWADADPVPKDLLRSAAQLRFSLNEGIRSKDVQFDVNEGLLMVTELVANLGIKEDADTKQLIEEFTVRIGGRGELKEITTDSILLLWELLAQQAREHLEEGLGESRAGIEALKQTPDTTSDVGQSVGIIDAGRRAIESNAVISEPANLHQTNSAEKISEEQARQTLRNFLVSTYRTSDLEGVLLDMSGGQDFCDTLPPSNTAERKEYVRRVVAGLIERGMLERFLPLLRLDRKDKLVQITEVEKILKLAGLVQRNA